MRLENALKIYDCFLFYNELDVLEIRLKELYDQVDYFIIGESNLSFTGNAKEYIFEQNKERFAPYLDKIRNIKIEDNPQTNNPWDREKHQRKALERGLFDASSEDVVIVSDCDEIPRENLIKDIKDGRINFVRLVLYLAQFNFKLNYFKVKPSHRHAQIIVTKFSNFLDPQREREFSFFWNRKPEGTYFVDHGGWHFTFFGNNEHCLNKLSNYSHTEVNKETVRQNIDIEEMIKNRHSIDKLHNPNNEDVFEVVKVDNYFPKAVISDPERWQPMIIQGAESAVTDIYKI